ncbi:hypothetical protein SAMN02745751_01782 [Dethiosulfatibacter aminovorans DSM 17477]|uniref:Lipoprotein n=1 Tax=Dethiosulfatibacter aminovorans DSM 17477 TaxID=1121476 RepID=A0A1M6GP30_9FIRM|nr:hypothetical protein [Dethiosulfatibacter aminovorans]SHJ11717.1 hypothetical protein SAMN02745751_01782 [Dethiosulfatibacter aminovorans DSM 17477]
MIYNRNIKIIWLISLVLTLAACLTADMDKVVIIGFTIVSAGLFLADLWKNYTALYSRSGEFKSIHAWNLISSIGQVFFWGYLFMFIFIVVDKTWYHWFIMVDLFVATTYLNYKFRSMMESISV